MNSNLTLQVYEASISDEGLIISKINVPKSIIVFISFGIFFNINFNDVR